MTTVTSEPPVAAEFVGAVLAELHRRGIDLEARPMAYVLGMGGELLALAAHAGVHRACDAMVRLAEEVERQWRSPRLERALRLAQRCRALALLVERDDREGFPASEANLALVRELMPLMAERERAYAELNGVEAVEYLRRCRQAD